MMFGPTLNRHLRRFKGPVKHAGLTWLSAGPALDVCIPVSFDRFSAWFEFACVNLRIVRMLLQRAVCGLSLGYWLRHRISPGGNIVDFACNVACGASGEESNQWCQQLSGAG